MLNFVYHKSIFIWYFYEFDYNIRFKITFVLKMVYSFDTFKNLTTIHVLKYFYTIYFQFDFTFTQVLKSQEICNIILLNFIF